MLDVLLDSFFALYLIVIGRRKAHTGNRTGASAHHRVAAKLKNIPLTQKPNSKMARLSSRTTVKTRPRQIVSSRK
jgi:hypothetical protein